VGWQVLEQGTFDVRQYYRNSQLAFVGEKVVAVHSATNCAAATPVPITITMNDFVEGEVRSDAQKVTVLDRLLSVKSKHNQILWIESKCSHPNQLRKQLRRNQSCGCATSVARPARYRADICLAESGFAVSTWACVLVDCSWS